MVVKGIVIVNNMGTCRIAKFYEPVHTEGEEQPEVIQQLVVRKIYNQICSRPDSFCNYLEGAIPQLDKCFENVCELDLIFHSDRVHYILDEIVMAGMVLDTNINNVLKATRDMTKLHQKSLSKLNDLVQSSPSRLSPSQRAAGHQGGSPF
ncbi:clathrin/adaptor complex [Aureococcus anophagefferens]|uniref:Clathrin/adaptor complex n=1 Tax=Aureococcus anophagefferens TaxID=44056 RepID=A0ABR1FPP9_AURAN|nr:hypothetical protein JL720_6064 [Aureococcus anophagefferens]